MVKECKLVKERIVSVAHVYSLEEGANVLKQELEWVYHNLRSKETEVNLTDVSLTASIFLEYKDIPEHVREESYYSNLTIDDVKHAYIPPLLNKRLTDYTNQLCKPDISIDNFQTDIKDLQDFTNKDPKFKGFGRVVDGALNSLRSTRIEVYEDDDLSEDSGVLLVSEFRFTVIDFNKLMKCSDLNPTGFEVFMNKLNKSVTDPFLVFKGINEKETFVRLDG
jgi:hypothetical protein